MACCPLAKERDNEGCVFEKFAGESVVGRPDLHQEIKSSELRNAPGSERVQSTLGEKLCTILWSSPPAPSFINSP